RSELVSRSALAAHDGLDPDRCCQTTGEQLHQHGSAACRSANANAMNETLIRGGIVVTADGHRRADLLCRDGLIAAVGAELKPGPGTQVVDAGGCFVMPGGI